MTPFAMPDPNAIPTPPEVPGADDGAPPHPILKEMGAAAALVNEIGALRPAILAAADRASARAAEELETTREYPTLSRVGFALRAAWDEYAAEAEDVKANRELSAEGRRAALMRAEVRRDQAIESAAAVVASQGDKLLSWFPPRTLAAPSAEVAAEAGLVLQRFALTGAASFLREAAAVLARASDPATPAPEGLRANQLLSQAYAPLLARRAVAPERFAQAYASQAAELAELVERHLDTATHATMRRHAAEFVQAVRREFAFANNTAHRLGKWDSVVIPMAAPTILNSEAA